MTKTHWYYFHMARHRRRQSRVCLCFVSSLFSHRRGGTGELWSHVCVEQLWRHRPPASYWGNGRLCWIREAGTRMTRTALFVAFTSHHSFLLFIYLICFLVLVYGINMGVSTWNENSHQAQRLLCLLIQKNVRLFAFVEVQMWEK